jgi:hypothetical protein
MGAGGGDDDDEEGLFNAKATNDEVDAGRARATPTSVRHDDDEPLTYFSPCYSSYSSEPLGLLMCSLRLLLLMGSFISPCYCTRAARPAHFLAYLGRRRRWW